MIPNQTSAIFVDLIVIVAVLAVIVVSGITGVFRKGRFPRAGRILLMSGVLVVGLYCLVDLLMILGSSVIVGAEDALLADSFPGLDIHLYTSLFSLLLTCTGFVLVSMQRRKVEDEMTRADLKVARIQQEVLNSEIRFRSFIEQTPDAVYCYELRPPVSCKLPASDQISRIFDAVLVESNGVFANSLGFASPNLALGTAYRQKNSVEPCRQLLEAFIDSGYYISGIDLDYTDSKGCDRAVKVRYTGVTYNGELVRIWGTEVDVLDQNKTKVALDGRNRFQQFVAALSSELIKAADENASDTLFDCLKQVCVFVGSDRANIVWFDTETERARMLYHWSGQEEPPWLEKPLSEFPWAVPLVSLGETVTMDTSGSTPAEAATDVETLRKLGLKSVAVIPMVIGNTTLGALTLGNVSHVRNWAEQDLADIRVIADLFSNIVVRINTRQSLDKALSELRLAKERLEAENVYLRQEISSTHGFDELIGESRQLRDCLRKVEQVAATDTAVLIQGETGTGKELIARATHERSSRSNRPLVKVNCAALPANLIESELFGYEKGAFTGAVSRKRGRFDLADGGTLFLDEIGDFPLELQGKLLRVIQDGEFQRLGGTETITSDVRLIAATNRDLPSAVDRGEFRADLFYRINTFPIRLPRLSDREGDVLILAQHFAKKYALQLGKDITAISATMMDQLTSYSWPGNVRELESVIQRALISSNGSVLELPEPLEVSPTVLKDVALAEVPPQLANFRVAERHHIEQVLGQANWVIEGHEGAAVRLGIPASTLRSKMKKLGISRTGHNI